MLKSLTGYGVQKMSDNKGLKISLYKSFVDGVKKFPDKAPKQQNQILTAASVLRRQFSSEVEFKAAALSLPEDLGIKYDVTFPDHPDDAPQTLTELQPPKELDNIGINDGDAKIVNVGQEAKEFQRQKAEISMNAERTNADNLAEYDSTMNEIIPSIVAAWIKGLDTEKTESPTEAAPAPKEPEASPGFLKRTLQHFSK